jgi:hypothetical protein
MTLASEVQMPQGAGVDEDRRVPVYGSTDQVSAVVAGPPSRGDSGAPVDADRLRVFLEDEVFGGWATEAAARYQVSALEAMGALAEALALDGTSRATSSTDRPDHLLLI